MKSFSLNILLAFSTTLFKSSQKKVLIFLFGTIICTGRCYSQERATKLLIVPKIEEGIPEAGKRVKIHLPEYPEAYYILFLPYNFTHTAQFPIIFESPGNIYNEISDGLPDSACLGYGISFGMDYIWVCVPFIDDQGIIVTRWYGDNPLSSVNFWLAVLDDLNSRLSVAKDKIILSGFSRGAIGVCCIGNYNDEIASKWSAYFAHSHFDGCCIPIPGLDMRLNRIGKKKVLITVGENDLAKGCSKEAYEKLLRKGHAVSYIEVPSLEHSPFWILENSESAENARNWLKNLFTEDYTARDSRIDFSAGLKAALNQLKRRG
jgi:hypothetical protein